MFGADTKKGNRFDSLFVYLLSTGGEARTPDTRFWRPVLYQLSYSRVLRVQR